MVDATEDGCTGFRDEPHQVIIVVDQMITCAQSQELGKVLGAHGFTGRFVGGTVAELVTLGANVRGANNG